MRWKVLGILWTFPLIVSAKSSFTSLQMRDVPAVPVSLDEKAAAKRLARAISFPTISNQESRQLNQRAFTELHRYLEKSFPLAHKNLKREALGDPHKLSLLYTWKGKAPDLKPLILMAHLDVVPVEPGTEKDWTRGAFSEDISAGYIWGRGSLDDKGMVLSILEAAELLLKENFAPTRTIHFIFGHDEEVGGLQGTKVVVEELKKRGVTKAEMVLDEGLPITTGNFPGLDAPLALIGTAEKGYLTLELKAEGPGGHSSVPPESTPIGVLARALAKIDVHPFPYRITPVVRDLFRYLGPDLPPENRAVFQEVALGTDKGPTKNQSQFFKIMKQTPGTAALLHTTTALTMFNGGIKDNVLPTSATAMVNFRILPGDTVQSVSQRITQLIDDKRVRIRSLKDAIEPSPVADAYGPQYKLIEKSLREIWRQPRLLVAPWILVASTDSKHLTSLTSNIYRFTPIAVETREDIYRWHGANERVLVSEHAKSIGFYHRFIKNSEELLLPEAKIGSQTSL